MKRKKIVLDILCFESFFSSSIGKKKKSDIYYLSESAIFSRVKKFYEKYQDVRFIKIGEYSYSEKSLGNKSLYEVIQEETKKDIFSFINSKEFTKDLAKYKQDESFNKQKFDYFLVLYFYHFIYRTREILSLIEYEEITPDFILVRKPHLKSLRVKNTKIPIKNYKILFSSFFKISMRDASLYDGFIYRKYKGLKISLIFKELIKKIMMFSNYFVFKDTDNQSSDKPKKQDENKPGIIGVDLVQSRINLLETNDLFFIENSIIDEEQICLVEYDEKPSLGSLFITNINKRNEPPQKYGKESYDFLSNKKYKRLKILNITNLLTQKYANEVNSEYKIRNLGFLIGPIVIFKYLLRIIGLVFHPRDKDRFLSFLLMQYSFDSEYFSKIFHEANLKIIWTMFDGGEEQLIKSQAIESNNGYFCGSHWSHYPLCCADNQKCYDILFTWSDHFSRMMNEYYQSKKTFIVGYPSTDYLVKYLEQAKRIREMHSGKFVITFNDNTYFNDGPVSEELYYSFYNLALEVLDLNDNVVIYLKPKRSNHFENYIKNSKKLDKYIDDGSLQLLVSDHSRSKVPPGFPALFSDLVIGLGLGTTTVESTIAGTLSLNFCNNLVFKDNPFYKNGINKIIFNQKDSLLKEIDKVMSQKDNDLYSESLKYYQTLDPYLDQNASLRISKVLLEILEEKIIVN